MRCSSPVRSLGLSAAVLALAGCASRPPGPPPAPVSPVNYYVRVLRAGVDRYDVSLAADHVERDSIDFILPTWTPGRYSGGAGGSAIESFSVRDGHGNPIATRRLGDGRWRLYPVGADYMTLGYQVVPGDGVVPLAFRTALDIRGGYALGAALFGFLEGHDARPVTVSFELPARWTVATPLDPLGPHRFEAASYASLPGTLFVVGDDRMRDYKLFVEGRPHQIVVQGGGPGFAPDSLLTLIGETVRDGTQLYGSPPYKRYLFALRFVPPGTVGIGATGQVGASAYFLPILESGRVRQAGVGTLLLHQYLHAWFPGNFGPTPLVRPDFSYVPDVPNLWLVEGAAEYYARLLPSRYGSTSREDFYDAMSELITWWDELGGGEWVDVRGLGSGGEESGSARLVVGGALAAFVLDIAIRGDTRGRAGLEDVLHYLQRGTPGGGYDATTVWGEIAAALDIPAEALSPLSSGSSVSVSSALGRAGLRLVERPERRRTLGARLLAEPSGRFVVRDVEPGGTAASAGLLEGDLLVEINGTPVGPDETVATRYALNSYIREAASGSRVSFEVIRDGVALERTGGVRETRVPRVTIEEISGSSAAALLVRSSLLSPPPASAAR